MMFWILVGLMSLLALAFVLIPIVRPGMGRKPLLIVALVLGVPLAAVMVYQKLGSPTATNTPVAMPSMPPMGSGNMPPMPAGAMPPNHPPSNAMNMDLGQLADRLAEKLKKQPENADGWALLARTYVQLKRYKDAVPAFEKAGTLNPKDPHFLSDYADALAMNNGGKFDKKAEGLIDQALALDGNHVKALMLKATLSFNRKDYSKAIECWEKVLKIPGIDAEVTKEANGSIQEARRMMGEKK